MSAPYYLRSVAGGHHKPGAVTWGPYTLEDALVVPFRRGSKPHSPADPLSTLATREQHGVLRAPTLRTEDAWFRMLKPREAANAQRFPSEYVIHGNRGEQQMQAGQGEAAPSSRRSQGGDAKWVTRRSLTCSLAPV